MRKPVKSDAEKPRPDLLPPIALEGAAQVMAYGARKYSPHNWRGGLAGSRLIGAALRHLYAWLRGEDLDPESGLPHLDHALCSLMMLRDTLALRPDLDDRGTVSLNPGKSGEWVNHCPHQETITKTVEPHSVGRLYEKCTSCGCTRQIKRSP
jgi:hypothetical protein